MPTVTGFDTHATWLNPTLRVFLPRKVPRAKNPMQTETPCTSKA